MSFFGSIPDPLAGTFSNNNSQQQQWGSQGTPPILPLPEPYVKILKLRSTQQIRSNFLVLRQFRDV
jgi:hypothetical protein